MVKLTSILIALTSAMVTLAAPSDRKEQVHICDSAELAPTPPSRTPFTNAVYIDYQYNNCTGSPIERYFVGNTCYFLPRFGGELKFHSCGNGGSIIFLSIMFATAFANHPHSRHVQ